jgi:hypothetical protein
MAVVGTTGVLSGMGASSAARSIATVAPLSSSGTVSRGIGQISATRQQAAIEYETSTALHDANQALGVHVFNAATSPTPTAFVSMAQTPSIAQWYGQQTQISPAQFLSRARQSHIITPQQYQAIARSPAAQADFTEGYKAQLESLVKYDASGNLSPSTVSQLASVRSSFQRGGPRSRRDQVRNRTG